jgi:hypothetical protein
MGGKTVPEKATLKVLATSAVDVWKMTKRIKQR